MPKGSGFRMRHILFGPKQDWAAGIARNLDCDAFACRFANLGASDFADFDAVVPLRHLDYTDLRAQQEWAGRKFLAPPEHLIRLCHDKLALNRFLLGTRHAALVPRILDPGETLYPCILMRREDFWGQNSHLIRGPEDVRRLGPLLEDPAYFRQAYIPGAEERATHILARDGAVLFRRTVIAEVAPGPYVMGRQAAPQHRRFAEDAAGDAALDALIATLGYTGTCCIDYKVEDRAVRLFEVNPRFGWSLQLDINAYLRAYLAALAG